MPGKHDCRNRNCLFVLEIDGKSWYLQGKLTSRVRVSECVFPRQSEASSRPIELVYDGHLVRRVFDGLEVHHTCREFAMLDVFAVRIGENYD